MIRVGVAALASSLILGLPLRCGAIFWGKLGPYPLVPTPSPTPPQHGMPRELFVQGGCPNIGDRCSISFSYSGAQGGAAGACVGLGTGSAYAAAACNFTNYTDVDASSGSYMLNGTCALVPSAWPASVSRTGAGLVGRARRVRLRDGPGILCCWVSLLCTSPPSCPRLAVSCARPRPCAPVSRADL
jgi:hypothetical protein